MNVNDLLAKFQPVGLSRDSAESFQQLEDSITKLSERIDKITSIQVPKDRYDYNIIRDLNREYKTLKENAQSLKDGDFSKRGEIELSAQSIDSLTKNLAKVNRGKDITEIEAHLDGIKKPLSDFTASLKNAASSGLDATKQAVSQGAQAVGSAIQRSGLPEDAEKIGSATLGPYFELAREIKNTGVVRNLFQSAKGFVKTLSKRTYSDSVESVDSYLKDKGVDEQNRQKVIAELKTTINEGRLSDVYDVLNDINSKMEESGASPDELKSRKESLTNFAQFAVAKEIIDSDDLSAKSVDSDDAQLELPFPEFKDRTSKAKTQSSEDKARPEIFTTEDYIQDDSELKEDVSSIDETTKEILAILTGDKKKKKKEDDSKDKSKAGIASMFSGLASILKNPLDKIVGLLGSGLKFLPTLARSLGSLGLKAGAAAAGIAAIKWAGTAIADHNAYSADASVLDEDGFVLKAGTSQTNPGLNNKNVFSVSRPIIGDFGSMFRGSNSAAQLTWDRFDPYAVRLINASFESGGNYQATSILPGGVEGARRGRYQVGADALATDSGLKGMGSFIDREKFDEVFPTGKITSVEKHKAFLKDNSNWRNIDLDEFLSDEEIAEYKRAWNAQQDYLYKSGKISKKQEAPTIVNYDTFFGDVEAEGRKLLGLSEERAAYRILQEKFQDGLTFAALRAWNQKVTLESLGIKNTEEPNKKYRLSELGTKYGISGENFGLAYTMLPAAAIAAVKRAVIKNTPESEYLTDSASVEARDKIFETAAEGDVYGSAYGYSTNVQAAVATAMRLIAEGADPSKIKFSTELEGVDPERIRSLAEQWIKFHEENAKHQEAEARQRSFAGKLVAWKDDAWLDHRYYDEEKIGRMREALYSGVFDTVYKGDQVLSDNINIKADEFEKQIDELLNSTTSAKSEYSGFGKSGGYGDIHQNKEELKGAEALLVEDRFSTAKKYIGEGKSNTEYMAWLLTDEFNDVISKETNEAEKQKLLNLRDAAWRVSNSRGWLTAEIGFKDDMPVTTWSFSADVKTSTSPESESKKDNRENPIVAAIASNFSKLEGAQAGAGIKVDQAVLPRVFKESFSKPVKDSTLSQTPRVEPQVTTPKAPEFEKVDPFKQQTTPTNNVTTNNTSIYQVGANYKQANVGE